MFSTSFVPSALIIEKSFLQYPYYLPINLSSSLKSHTILIPLLHNVRTTILLVKLSVKFCNPIGFRRKSSWTIHLFSTLSLSSQGSLIKQLNPIAQYMTMYMAILGSKERSFLGPPSSEEKDNTCKMLEGTLTLVPLLPYLKGRNSFSYFQQ